MSEIRERWNDTKDFISAGYYAIIEVSEIGKTLTLIIWFTALLPITLSYLLACIFTCMFNKSISKAFREIDEEHKIAIDKINREYEEYLKRIKIEKKNRMEYLRRLNKCYKDEENTYQVVDFMEYFPE
jgi:hypothetical protein